MIVKIYLNETTIPVIFSGSSVNIEYGNNEVDFKDGKVKIKTNRSDDVSVCP